MLFKFRKFLYQENLSSFDFEASPLCDRPSAAPTPLFGRPATIIWALTYHYSVVLIPNVGSPHTKRW
ncbi:MAG: hypothetical protein IJM78_01360 [Prevotella sp.]|nr:hypothetical protein [Prevotella sp.]